MIKKIGCVIAYKKNHTNYGTSLVGYALLKKLQQLGYDIEVVNYIKHPTFREKAIIAINQFRVVGIKQFIKRFIPHPSNANYVEGISMRTASVESYKKCKIEPLFHSYVGYKDLCEGSKNYDAVVVGSDQVWLPQGLRTKFYNLLFVDDNVRKISYASSFGVSEIPKFQKKDTAYYLNRFYAISVREQRGKEIVQELSTKQAIVVADPTLLLDAKEWEEEIKDSHITENEPYIFCYFLGRNTEARKAANELRTITGYKIVTLRHMDEFIPEDEMFGDEAPYEVDPNDFVKYISKAAFVCTDSFHCTAFSIQFHRKFMTFYRFQSNEKGGRNSRIDSLFNVLSIPQEHIYSGNMMNINSLIDWESVDNRLLELRQKSISFLKNALQ